MYFGNITEMSQKIHKLTVDLEKSRSEKADEMALRVQMESKVRVLLLILEIFDIAH
jgi:hypothetical protein